MIAPRRARASLSQRAADCEFVSSVNPYIGANIGGIFGRGDAHFNDFEVGSNERSGFTDAFSISDI
jgi:hypothetical protein